MLCVEDTASDDDGGAGEGVAGEDGAKGGGGDVGDEEGDVHVVLFLGVAVLALHGQLCGGGRGEECMERRCVRCRIGFKERRVWSAQDAWMRWMVDG